MMKTGAPAAKKANCIWYSKRIASRSREAILLFHVALVRPYLDKVRPYLDAMSRFVPFSLN